MSDEHTTDGDLDETPEEPSRAHKALAGLTREVPRDPDGGEGRASLLTGLIFSWAGFAGYQFFVHPTLPFLSETVRRFGLVSLVLAVVVIVRPRLHPLLLTLLFWGILLVVVAIDSALPVGFIDLAPRPSFTLYAAHLVLASAQVPLVSSAWGRLWAAR